jgi:hypothetical protein
MFLTALKTLLVTALNSTFDNSYPVAEWRGLYSSIEYPIKRGGYPSIWVDFEPVDDIRINGIGDIFTSGPDTEGNFSQYLKWLYQGHATFTIVAMSSYERDRLFDQLVSVIAFGRMNPQRSVFRNTIVDNEFIAAQFDWDSMAVRGFGQNPGTPWGSDEIIYEVTISMDMEGEFNSNISSTALIPLEKITIAATPEA